jgi:rod shape-determining protein MreD
MIMRPGQPLLLPANPLFIWGSLLLALMLNMMLNMGLMGRQPWVPDVLALVLVFWGVHQPLRVGVGIAFAFGLAMDVHHTSLLGQHALAYTVLGYLAASLQHRLLWFPTPVQALHLLPLFTASQALVTLTGFLAGGASSGWSVVLAPVLTSALWPIGSWLLLAPQHGAHDLDANRPL